VTLPRRIGDAGHRRRASGRPRDQHQHHRLGEALSALGLRLGQATTVTDDIDAIVREAEAVVGRGTDLCVVSGGLGPTADDLTAEAFARLAHIPLVRDPAQQERIAIWLKKRGRKVGDNQYRQADRPQGATVVPNDWGIAPGFALVVGGCRFVSAPGVPHEFDRMIEAAVLRELRLEGGGGGRRIFLCFGLMEAEVDARLVELPRRFPAVRVAFQVKFPEIHVVLSADADHVADLDGRQCARPCGAREPRIRHERPHVCRGRSRALAGSRSYPRRRRVVYRRTHQ